MEGRDAFAGCHPAAQFCYFGMVLLFSMCLMDPVCLAISLAGAVAYSARLKGRRALGRQLLATLPVLVMTVLVNVAFNHRGATVLARFPTGSPLTLESVLYGLTAALMLCAVLSWFVCYSVVMTSDRFVYLFGRKIPALSLVLTMALRFVPRFTGQLRVIMDAQRGMGREVTRGPLRARLRAAVDILSVLVTWSLENAIETADSMKSRGYGLPGRTAFSIYHMEERDRLLLIWLGFCGFVVACGWAAGGFFWSFDPVVRLAPWTIRTVALRGVYLALCLTPALMGAYGDRRWARQEKGGVENGYV